MGKLLKNTSKDRGMLHMKMVVDTTETKKYVKQIPKAFEKVSTNLLLKVMREVIKETQGKLRGHNSRKSKVWDVSKGQRDSARKGHGMFESTTTATKKIAASLRVAETRQAGIKGQGAQNAKGSASVSAWSHDTEFAKASATFTSAGVRGSRAKTGKKFAGKIAEYYEQGRQPWSMSPGRSQFTHRGYPKLAYMAKAQAKANELFRTQLDKEMERRMRPEAEYESTQTKGRSRQVGESDWQMLMKSGALS